LFQPASRLPFLLLKALSASGSKLVLLFFPIDRAAWGTLPIDAELFGQGRTGFPRKTLCPARQSTIPSGGVFLPAASESESADQNIPDARTCAFDPGFRKQKFVERPHRRSLCNIFPVGGTFFSVAYLSGRSILTAGSKNR
jgi:hypothetical protein